MSGWESYPSATKMRDIIKRIATSVVDELRPADKIGRVVDIDRGALTAWVVYSGDETTKIRVRMLPGRQPQFADSIQGIGQGSIVRVSGALGSRYVTEVVSHSPYMQYPRLFNPTVALASGIEGVVQSIFALSTASPPPADGTNYYTAVLNFPNWGGQINITTLAKLASGKTWVSSERFQFDDTTATGSDIPATLVAQSSTGMDMVTKFNIHTGDVDGFDPSTAGLNMSLVRASTSTKSVTSCQVHVICTGVDVRLVQQLDGSLSQ